MIHIYIVKIDFASVFLIVNITDIQNRIICNSLKSSKLSSKFAKQFFNLFHKDYNVQVFYFEILNQKW